MEIISVVAEFDQDRQERYVKVKLFDNELDELREAMQRHRDRFLENMNVGDAEDKRRMAKIENIYDKVRQCWKIVNPS